MKKILFFVLFSVFLTGQKTQLIEFKQSIKDKSSHTKSLTLIDRRTDKTFGEISSKKDRFEMSISNANLTALFAEWFEEDNKTKGTNDIVLVLEELKFYNEQAPNDIMDFAKAKIKISSFLKRNDKYYFINRFDNVVLERPFTSTFAKNLSRTVSEVIAEFIKSSYNGIVLSYYIPEHELENYDSFLSKNNKSLTEPLKEGVYFSYKSFFEQNPSREHYIEKNNKGIVKRIKNNQDLSISMSEVFCYLDNGIPYRVTAAGFKEMKKNEKGFYISASRTQVFAEKGGTGVMVGAIAGGLVGAAIGAAIDSESNKGSAIGYGFKSSTFTNVRIDPLTGSFSFKE